MPIREIHDRDLEQECIACGRSNMYGFDAITAGIAHEERVDPNIIRLPVCGHCGAQEFLIRSPSKDEHPAPGSYGHLHRLLVDELHARLVNAGRLEGAIDAENIPRHEPNPEILRRYFPERLRLVRGPAKDASDT